MSTQHAYELQPVETRSQAVARRLRGKLGESRITGSELARRLGVTQSYISRHLSGKVSFDLDELDAIESVTGISADYLLGVQAEDAPPPRGGIEAPKADLVGTAGRNKVTSLYKNESIWMEDAYRHLQNSPLRRVA